MTAAVAITLEAFSQTADEIAAMFKDSLHRHGIDVSSVQVSIDPGPDPWPVESPEPISIDPEAVAHVLADPPCGVTYLLHPDAYQRGQDWGWWG